MLQAISLLNCVVYSHIEYNVAVVLFWYLKLINKIHLLHVLLSIDSLLENTQNVQLTSENTIKVAK